MTTVAQCRMCHGSGTVEFTREYGGPVCNHCGGNGFLTKEILGRYIGAMLDHPSVYMGGPSRGSLAKAKNIIEFLQEEGILDQIP